MTLQKLASKLCKLEGKKSQVHIGNMRETIKLLIKIIADEWAESGFMTSETGDLLETEINKLINKTKPPQALLPTKKGKKK